MTIHHLSWHNGFSSYIAHFDTLDPTVVQVATAIAFLEMIPEIEIQAIVHAAGECTGVMFKITPEEDDAIAVVIKRVQMITLFPYTMMIVCTAIKMTGIPCWHMSKNRFVTNSTDLEYTNGLEPLNSQETRLQLLAILNELEAVKKRPSYDVSTHASYAHRLVVELEARMRVEDLPSIHFSVRVVIVPISSFCEECSDVADQN